MKWYQKVLIALGLFIVLAIIINISLNLWIQFHLPKIINKKNDSAYVITYKNLKVSFWNSSIIADEIVFVPKRAVKDTIHKEGLYGKIRGITIHNFKMWAFLFSDKLKAQSITIEAPTIVLYEKKKRDNLRESVVKPFEKIITVSDVTVHQGDLKIINFNTQKPVLSAQNINIQLDGIVVSEALLKEKIPFEFRDYAVTCDSLYYLPNEFYHISTKKVTVNKSNVAVTDFKMIPTHTRQEYVAKMKTEKDIYTLNCPSITLDNMDWGFQKDDFFVHCNSVNINEVSANIYRSKEPADDLTKKHLYNKLLRDLPFDLKVNTLKIRNSILEYEEAKSFDLGSGKLRFSHFNLTATNICSGFKKTTLPDLEIKIDCRFMNTSPLHVNWTLNVLDVSDGFNINGTLTHFDAEKIIPFTKPYLNVTTKGIIDELRFDFTGNNSRNSGEFKVEYDDLKFTVYQKDNRKKKNKLLTFVSKIFVKKDTKDRLKNVSIEVKRIPEKSFYNLLWRSIAEGLKQILV